MPLEPPVISIDFGWSCLAAMDPHLAAPFFVAELTPSAQPGHAARLVAFQRLVYNVPTFLTFRRSRVHAQAESQISTARSHFQHDRLCPPGGRLGYRYLGVGDQERQRAQSGYPLPVAGRL